MGWVIGLCLLQYRVGKVWRGLSFFLFKWVEPAGFSLFDNVVILYRLN
jgi:hypothetical protein